MKRFLSWTALSALAALLLAGWWRLDFDPELLNLLPDRVASVQGLKVYQEHFSESGETWILLAGADAEPLREAARSLARRLQDYPATIAGVDWRPPFEAQPEALAELIAWQWLNSDPASFARVVSRWDPIAAEDRFREVRERMAETLSPMEIARLGRDPLGLLHGPGTGVSLPPDGMSGGANEFASRDGLVRVLHVHPVRAMRDYRECGRWLEFLEQEIVDWRENAPEFAAIRTGLTGQPAFVAETASGMESDMRRAVTFTVVFIVAVFWLAHRRLKPLLWLLFLLGAAVVAVFGLAGLFLGSLNAISAGFAAILLGVTADYGIVLYQDFRERPGADATEANGSSPARGVGWSAWTTAAAFGALMLGGLPGLAQLGLLVALGVLLAAGAILMFYLKPLRAGMETSNASHGREARAWNLSTPCRVLAVLVPLLVLLVLGLKGQPGVDFENDPMQSRHSQAQRVLEEINTRLEQDRHEWMLVVRGSDEERLWQRVREVRESLEPVRKEGAVDSILLPDAILPNRANRTVNLPLAHACAARMDGLEKAAASAGFAPESLDLTRRVVAGWRSYPGPGDLPGSAAVRGLLDRAYVSDAAGCFALGLVVPADHGMDARERLESALNPIRRSGDVWVTSWEFLGADVLAVAREGFWWVLLPMIVLVLASLLRAFRSGTDVVFCLGAILLSGASLLAWMSLMGWEWTLLNLMAIPLLLGLSVDYSIHMLFAARRFPGEWQRVWRTTGRALMLCALTTAAGFGSLTFTQNQGLGDLGRVCASGVVCAWLCAVVVLPGWRSFWGSSKVPGEAPAWYGAWGWQLGLTVARRLPVSWARSLGSLAGALCHRILPTHRKVIQGNLLPVVEGDATRARAETRRLFRCFGRKLVDLWLFESGRSVPVSMDEATASGRFQEAKAKGRGVILVTLHLGNWEVGGAALTRQGEKLLVLSQEEPGGGFSELRGQGRAHWGIETLIVGQSPFAFVEVIRRLERNSTVALLLDRPESGSSVQVNFFGRPFLASRGAAELARASGCALLPVAVVEEDGGYSLKVLPSVDYDPAGLRDLGARRELTERILRAFEPLLREYPEQWFQFLPQWTPSEEP